MKHKPVQYSHTIALMAYSKASLKAIFRNPSAVVFGFFFPLVFIMVFGLIGNSTFRVDVGLNPKSDTKSEFYQIISNIPSIHLISDEPIEKMEKDIKKAELDAIILFEKTVINGKEVTKIHLQTSAVSRNASSLVNIMDGIIAKINLSAIQNGELPYQLTHEQVEGREYRMIDFILPGQLGFVILSSGVISTAFLLISLKQRLVVKRFFATPAKRSTIIIGEAIARLIFSAIQVLFIIMIGVFGFHFTLINGFFTLIEMLLICSFGLIVFLGVGMIVSSIAKNEQAVPPIANLFTLPQFFLSGAFFSITVFPSWLQPFCKILPLTFVNDALRKIAFDGASFGDISLDLLGMTVWGIVVYAVVIKVFKWEN